MAKTLTLRGIALADAVRMFRRHGVPMVVRPLAADEAVPPGWLPVVMATPQPKHKSASTNRRNRERQGWRAKKSAAAEGAAT